MSAIETLLGKVITDIQGGEGDDEITFTVNDGYEYKMYHQQDCCESVEIESIVGDLDDLIGRPLLRAEEVNSDHLPGGEGTGGDYGDSYTWTFYKLATIRGYVDIRWYGQSNGYYSERVDWQRRRLGNQYWADWIDYREPGRWEEDRNEVIG
jgi:hypothetical protein